MVQKVAGDMGNEDVQTTIFQYDLPADYGNKPALETLRKLEVRGNFSDSDIGPLLELLQNIDRHDLINKHVMPYQQQSFSLHCECGRRGKAAVHLTFS